MFAKLHIARTISLLGNAFTWVGLAWLAYELGAVRTAIILSSALTLRVIAFIIFPPYAGVLADKINRKKILYITHFIRMGIVACLPFIRAEWQIYVFVLLLNIFNDFFAPTYKSIIPQIVDKRIYRQAIGLSTSTYQLLGVLGPGLAGKLAIWLGAREMYFVDAASIIIAGILILTLPGKLISKGVARAQILVNTVDYDKYGLRLTARYYGLAMAAFGIGAAVAAFISGAIDKSSFRRFSLICGALLLGLAIIGAGYAGFSVLFSLWILAGLGQSLAKIPSETLIGEQTAPKEQEKYTDHISLFLIYGGPFLTL